MQRERGANLDVELADGRTGELVEAEALRVLVRFPDGSEEWVGTAALTEKAAQSLTLPREIGS